MEAGGEPVLVDLLDALTLGIVGVGRRLARGGTCCIIVTPFVFHLSFLTDAPFDVVAVGGDVAAMVFASLFSKLRPRVLSRHQ